MGEVRNAYSILLGKSEGERQFGNKIKHKYIITTPK
jgi:hypothetical protein